MIGDRGAGAGAASRSRELRAASLGVAMASRQEARLDRDRLQSLAAAAADAQLSSSSAPLVRLLAQRAVRAPRLDFDTLYSFIFAAFRWVAADEEYCRLYCLPDRSDETEARTRAAAASKHAARENLEAELRAFGINSWSHTDAADARQRVRQILQHARGSEPEAEVPHNGASPSHHRPRRKQAISAGPASALASPASPARDSPAAVSRQPRTPVRVASPSDASGAAEVQRLRDQVIRLERRVQHLEEDNERLTGQVEQLSLDDDSSSSSSSSSSSRVPGQTVVEQLVQQAVAVAMAQGGAVGAAPRTTASAAVAAGTLHTTGGGLQQLPPPQGRGYAKGSAMSESELLHWAATRIQAVHRGKVNRSIGDE